MDPFQGIGRTKVERILGTGSFGRVYLAQDEDRGHAVAIKRLTRLGPEGLFQFKQEFRLLADLNHPNLVSLYELYAETGDIAFTMEYVDGLPFVAWARGMVAEAEGSGSSAGTGHSYQDLPTQGSGPGSWTSDSREGPRTAPAGSALRMDRLRPALVQLAQGISVLHGAGILHLDLKSNNVLVTGEGRVVLLDFGLSREQGPETARQQATRLHGTPSHVAPELVRGHTPTEASDWYSMGAMLFECLTGRLPFLGTAVDMLQAKLSAEAPSPMALVPDLPEDLVRLCEALLRRDPAQRPSGPDILAALDAGAPKKTTNPAKRKLLGREDALETLTLAQAATQGGHFQAALVHGPPGMGKSFLIRHFLRQVERAEARAVTLLGRCFEQESVPFKGLDNLVDSLSRYLRHLPPAELEPLLPRNPGPLAKLFPVLGQVLAPGGEGSAPEEGDAQELRRQAFRTLRELLTRLAASRPLVLALDDFQWADADTVTLLLDLIRPPEAPGLLLVVGYRIEGAEGPSALRTFLDAIQETKLARSDVALDRLIPATAVAVAMEMVGDPERAAAIALEARGNPWMIKELALNEWTQPEAGGGAPPFHALVAARLADLPDHALELLRLLSVAGYPLAWDLVRRATRGWQGDPVALLRNHHLIRIRGTPRHRLLEPYHDRIREAVVAGLAEAEVKACHLQLARALEASESLDVQALTTHFFAAGETTLAAEYSLQAAHQSQAALAFDRAAGLFLKTLALRPPEDPRIPTLRALLADALANAGRSVEAAMEYRAAAAEAPEEAARLNRRAAEEFFRSGHVAEGLTQSRSVLAQAGLRIPSTPARAMASLLYHRFRLVLRGMTVQERAAEHLPPGLLDRIDLLWSMAMGLGPFDLVRATDFQTRHLLLALEAGEPLRLVRGLAHETALRSAKGQKAAGLVQGLLSRTLALAERIGRPEALARAQLAASIAATAQGRWRSAVEWAVQAETTLQQGCSGVTYERHLAQFYRLRNAMLLGEFPDVRPRYQGLLQEARGQGDLLTTTNLQLTIGGMLRLVEDDAAGAHRTLDQAMEGWPQDAFLLQDFECLTARGNVLLHQDRPAEALSLVEDQWPRLARSLLLKAQAVRVTALELRIRVLLATGQDAAARRWNRALAREACDYGKALALKNLAILEARASRRTPALERLSEAEMALRACELHLHAECVRRLRGVYLGDLVGMDLLIQADEWMSSRGIQNPERMVRMLATGLD